jgi:hypothetical protein
MILSVVEIDRRTRNEMKTLNAIRENADTIGMIIFGVIAIAAMVATIPFSCWILTLKV